MGIDTVTTKTISSNLAETEEYVLYDTSQTEIVFKAQIHDGGVRGSIIRYKKDKNGNREEIIPVDFRSLKANEGIEIKLKTEAISKLYLRIKELQAVIEKRGIEPGTHKYQIATADNLVITDQNKSQVIKKLLEANYGEEVWLQLGRDNPDLSTKLAYSRLQENRTAALQKFNDMLSDDTLDESVWQTFFEENTWIFGYGLRYQFLSVFQAQPNYGGTTVEGKGGQRGDFLTATEAETKFTCLVEIKKPSTPLLQKSQYRNGAWRISNELSGAISQVQVNCSQWEISGSRTDQNRELLEGISTISPKGIVVVGNTRDLNSFNEKNSFELFRRELNNPEIITYDELFERAKFIVDGESQNTQFNDELFDDDLPF